MVKSSWSRLLIVCIVHFNYTCYWSISFSSTISFYSCFSLLMTSFILFLNSVVCSSMSLIAYYFSLAWLWSLYFTFSYSYFFSYNASVSFFYSSYVSHKVFPSLSFYSCLSSSVMPYCSRAKSQLSWFVVSISLFCWSSFVCFYFFFITQRFPCFLFHSFFSFLVHFLLLFEVFVFSFIEWNFSRKSYLILKF